MPLLLLPSNTPELAAAKRLPPEERKRVWARVWPRARGHWLFWAGGTAAAAAAVAVWVVLREVVADAGVTGVLNGAVTGAVAGLVGGTILGQAVNRVAVPLLREELARGPDAGVVEP